MASASAATLPSWISAGAATVAALAAITYGALNLRRAKRGPDGSPRWSLQHVNKQRYSLVQNGTADAHNVQVRVEPDNTRVNGQSEFEVFTVGQQASYLIASSWQEASVRLHVSWTVRKGVWPVWWTVRREWSTDVN